MSHSAILKKFNNILSNGDFDGMIIWGSDNFTYLTQMVLPFAPGLPHKKTALVMDTINQTLFCPADYSQFFLKQGWEKAIIIWDENLTPKEQVTLIKKTITKTGSSDLKWGVDSSRTSQALWDELTEAGVRISDSDVFLREARMVKEPFEIKTLEWASRMAERGLVSTLNHTEGTYDAVSYSRAETAERMRVHVAEFGGQAVGHVSALQGTDLQCYFGVNHDRVTNNGFTRYDLTTAYKGYWSSAGRTIYVGKAPKAAKQAYMNNLILKSIAEGLLRPGKMCCEIFEEVKKASERMCIPYLESAGIGYGVGVSEREAPFLNNFDTTVLVKGMVIALDIWTFGPDGEWIHSIDTYEITEKGCNCISWYRDYDRLYEMVGITARHG